MPMMMWRWCADDYAMMMYYEDVPIVMMPMMWLMPTMPIFFLHWFLFSNIWFLDYFLRMMPPRDAEIDDDADDDAASQPMCWWCWCRWWWLMMIISAIFEISKPFLDDYDVAKMISRRIFDDYISRLMMSWCIDVNVKFRWCGHRLTMISMPCAVWGPSLDIFVRFRHFDEWWWRDTDDCITPTTYAES